MKRLEIDFNEKLRIYFYDYLIFYDDKYRTYILIFKLKRKYSLYFFLNKRKYYKILEGELKLGFNSIYSYILLII